MEQVLTEEQKTQKLKEYITKVSDIIASDEDVKKFVTDTESGLKTTKGNYGKYMSFLSTQKKNGRAFTMGVAEGLKKAGADYYGVDWAMRLLYGGY